MARPLRVVVALLAAALVPTALAAPVGAAGARACPPLQIGLLARFAGPAATAARHELIAAQLAVGRFTAAHPDCPVTVVPLDGGADGTAMGTAIRDADDPALVAVVGPQRSDDTLVVGALLEYLGLPFVTMSATRPSLSEQGWRTFHRAVGSDLAQGDAATSVIDGLRPGKVAVVDDGTAYGTALAARVRTGLGDTPTVDAHVTPDGSGVDAAVSALAGLGPDDVVFYAGYDTAGLPLLQALRAAGNPARLLGGDGFATDAVTASGATAEGVIVTCPCAPPERIRRAAAFVAAFTAATGTPPLTADRALETFDATNVVLAAIGRGAHTRAAVQQALRRTRIRGLTGTIAFDRRGEVVDPTIWSYRVERGALVPIGPVTDHT